MNPKRNLASLPRPILSVAVVLLAYAGAALAQSSSADLSAIFQRFCVYLKVFSGLDSIFVAFIAGVAIIVFFVTFMMDESNKAISSILRILFGVTGLAFLPVLLSNVFGLTSKCT